MAMIHEVAEAGCRPTMDNVGLQSTTMETNVSRHKVSPYGNHEGSKVGYHNVGTRYDAEIQIVYGIEIVMIVYIRSGKMN